MPPRPSALKLKQNRPSSAIYLGNNPALSQSHSSNSSYGNTNSTPPNLPDLPEPPSPSASSSSHGSGLPSPPATNSTGSGSTGDPGSISIRQRPVSLNSSGSSDHSGNLQASMLNGPSSDAIVKKDEPLSIYNQHSRNGSRHSLGPELIEGGEDDDVDESGNEDGEDNTARLDRKISLQSSSENMLALQRVKRLTQRNRTTLDKLSSLSSSRLSTPSPSHASRSTARSPIPPPPHSSSSSSSHASSSRLSQTRRPPPPPPDQGLSGSETERESSFSHSNTHSSTSQHTHTSSLPYNDRPRTPIHPSHNNPRFRLASAPTSPRHLSENTTTSSSSSNNPHSPTRRRKRTSLAATSTPRLGMEQEDDGASARKRDPRARGALPREFLRGDDGERVNFGRGADQSGRYSAEPLAPNHNIHHTSVHQTPSVTQPRSPGRHQPSRSTSVRGYGTRAHQGRWVSEDLSSSGMIDRTISSGSGTSSVSFDLDPERPSPSSTSTGPKERRQSLRGGSVESVLGAGRTLVGQGLRAAGLGWRGDDTSRGGGARIDLGLGEAKSEDVFKVPNRRERRVEWNDGDVRGARDIDADRRRAATSMADYRYADRDPSDDEPMTAPPTALRSYRSAFPLRDSREGDATFARETEQERERAGSALSRTESTSSRRPERYSSPFDGKRRDRSSVPPPQAEHTRLMIDSLGMFETHLARAGLAGGQLSKNAQIIAHNAERLNGILKQGVSRALEAEVEAEIDDEGRGTDELVEAWRSMGTDYRDGLKVSDELVRGVTGFLLGIGKVLRDVGGDIGHIRSASGSAAVLTEDVRVRGSPSPDTAASGRRSADSKQSWEPTREREGGRDEALRKLTGRSEGNLDMPRPSSTLRERNRETHYETPPQPQGPLPSKATPKNPVASMRRLFTPREQREQQMQLNGRGLVPSDSQDTIHGYEPSPSPAPRNQGNQNTTLDRSRTLPPLRMPKPLPTLPSESTLRRNQTLSETPPTNTNRDRNKISVGSVTTVRGSIPPFPAISTPNATTALTTHTVSNSPVVSASPLSRTDSDKSTRSMVTFSRPSTVSSVSALSGLQQQHLDYERSRTTSSASSAANPDPSPAVKTKTGIRTPVTPMSGSETERDMRRKTLGARGMRMSLDNAPVESRTVNAADRGATSKVLPQLGSGSRRERRRTVTDIWPRD